VVTLNARFGDEWGQGIHLVYTAAAAFAVIGLAAGSPRPTDRPATWQSVLFVTSFFLLFATLLHVADVLGADDPPNASGTIVWIGVLLISLSLWFALAWNSGISTLLSALTLVVVIVAFVDWVFSPDEIDTFRWVLLLTAAGLLGFGAMRRGGEPHHAVGDVNAAGVAIFALAVTFVVDAFSFLFADPTSGAAFDVGWGWELVILAAAAALIAYSVAERQAGPGYLGALNLGAFVSLAAGPGEDGPSLIGWPLVLIIVTIGLFAMSRGGGRPGAGVPASPPPGPDEAPTAVQPRP
jgi:hypothetical protein